MTDEQSRPSIIGMNRSPASMWRFFGKWSLISLAVLITLVTAENLLVEFQSPVQSSGSSNSNVGEEFESYAKFIEYQESLGYFLMGRFQDQWPAKIVEERSEKDAISFELKGTKHQYPGYEGLEFKLVRLRTQRGAEAVIVLRSAVKQ
jgi:hypothetical protein